MDATRESISGERVGDDELKWTVFISDNSNSESRLVLGVVVLLWGGIRTAPYFFSMGRTLIAWGC